MEESLSELEQEILRLESARWPTPGAKDREIRRRLSIPATEYYLRLNALLDDPRAVAAQPMLVRRLRAQRDRTLGW